MVCKVVVLHFFLVLVLWLKILEKDLAQVFTLLFDILACFLVELLCQEGAATVNEVPVEVRAVLSLVGDVTVLEVVLVLLTLHRFEGQKFSYDYHIYLHVALYNPLLLRRFL